MASDCPSVGAMTVTKPTLCANVRVIRLEVCLLSMVSGVLLLISPGCRCGFGLPFCWSNDCDQTHSVCKCESHTT